MSIGDLIKQLRKDRGLTQKQLSSLSGVAQSAISHAESNEREPGFDVLHRLCDAFNISISSFFDMIDKSEPRASRYHSDEENSMLFKYRLLRETDKVIINSMIDSLFSKTHIDSKENQNINTKNETMNQNLA